MRNGILVVMALTACGVALADPPPQQPIPPQVVEDINSLREELGQSNSSPAEFFQAMQRMMSQVESDQHRHQKAAEARHNAQAWAYDGGYIGHILPVTDQNSSRPPHYGSSVVSPPSHLVTHHHPRPPRPPKVLLVDTAFELERMAHDLERAELYGEADSLREAAGRLRQTARQQKKADGRPPQPPVVGAAPGDHPHAAERARRAVEEANNRVKRLERQVAEGESRFKRQAEAMARLMEDRQRREWQRTERRGEDGEKAGEKQRRHPGAYRPQVEIAPSEVNPAAPQPSYDLLAPPDAGKAEQPPADGSFVPADPQN